jgi:PAS domain S-box-containing protein
MPQRGGIARIAACAVAVCAAYYLGAWIGFQVRFPSLPTSIFWLPNATMFAVFLLAPLRQWWIYALAVIPAHLAIQIQNGAPTMAMVLLYPSNLADGALAAFAVRRFGGSGPPLQGLRNFAAFLASAVAAPFVVSFLDAGIVVGDGWAHDYWLVWLTRFRSNVLTNLLWVPAVVIAVSRGGAWLRAAPISRAVEAVLLGVLAVAAAGLFGLGGSMSMAPLVYAPVPLLLWAAARFEIGGVAGVLLLFASTVILSATHGFGPFAGASPTQNTMALQVFLTTLAIPFLLLGALYGEQRLAKRALADREAQYRGVFESTSDGILVTDPTNAVAAANPAFYRLTGYSPQQLRAGHPRDFLHLDDLNPLDTYLNAVPADGPATTQAVCVCADGRLVRVELHATRFVHGGADHVLSVVRDVTEREHALRLLEQKVAERTRELSTLLQISSTVASTLDLETVIGVVLGEIQSLFGCTGATVMIADGGELVVLDHRGPVASEPFVNARFPAEWASGYAEIRRGSPLIVDNVWDDSPTATAFRSAAPPGLLLQFRQARSLLVVPLKVRDQLIGVLFIESDRAGRYQLRDAQLAWALANQAAVAIENARLYEQARELAALEERQRLARDLHDSVTQSLHSAWMVARTLPKTWDRDANEARQMLEHLDDATGSALAELRTLLIELRPSALLQADLGDLLRQLARGLRSRIEKPIIVDAQGAVVLPTDVQVAFYRVAQAALGNVAKHASSAQARVSLNRTEGSTTMVIADDGPGFEVTHAEGQGRMGLEIMRERAKAIRAVLEIESAPDRGTRIVFHWSRRDGEEPPLS